MKAGANAAVLAAITLASCGRAPNESAKAGVRNPWTTAGVFRYAVSSDPKSLNPALYPLGPTPLISMFIYSWAIRYDGNAHPVPDALREIPTVANGDVSRDGLTLRYKLRPGIAWQDGQPLTCGDLKFTWQVVMNPHNNVATTEGYRDIRSIDCSNRYVAVIRMRRVYAPYLQQLWGIGGNAPILPAHILARYNDDKGSFNTAPYNALPLGSGPFKVVSWERGEEVRMVANPRFYLGRPKLDVVIFKIVPDANAAEILLREHQIDMMSASQMNWPRLAALATDPRNGLVASWSDQFEWTHVDFNLARPIVGDRDVRVALAYATDRHEIVEKLLHGLPIEAQTDQSPRLSWAYTNDVTHYPYDPQRARAILDTAGWKVGADGIRVKAGRRLEFEFSACTEYKGEIAIQTLLQQRWHEIGAQADIKNYSHNLFFDNSPAGVLQGGHYDAAIQSSTSGPDPDHSVLYSAANLAPRGQNTLQWRDLAATAALNAALRSVDQAQRKRYYAIVQQRLAHDVPTIVLNFIRSPVLYNRDLRGFHPSPVWMFWDPWTYSI